jgi:hypothetical protein
MGASARNRGGPDLPSGVSFCTVAIRLSVLMGRG